MTDRSPTLGARPPACTAAQLRATAGQSQGLTGGTRVLAVQFQNTSRTPCLLDGQPAVTMRGSAGKAIPARDADLDGFFGRQAAVSLAPGRGGAYLPISLSALTEAGDGPCRRPQPVIAQWAITLPGGRGTVVADSEEPLTTCDGRMRVGAITPEPAQ